MNGRFPPDDAVHSGPWLWRARRWFHRIQPGVKLRAGMLYITTGLLYCGILVPAHWFFQLLRTYTLDVKKDDGSTWRQPEEKKASGASYRYWTHRLSGKVLALVTYGVFFLTSLSVTRTSTEEVSPFSYPLY